MHQLAIALKRKGYIVTGSDDEIFEPARSNLAAEGLLPAEDGWFPEKIYNGLDSIILGMHAKADNPELLKAQELRLPIYSFPEYIYQESKDKTRVVVGGSHGKTTTTSMIMNVLKNAGKDFDYLVGARLEGFPQSVNITQAPLIVCEGDEYPASTLEKRPKFHFLFPHIAIITGIAWDHINVFPTFDIYLEQFRIFIDKIEPGGVLIYNQTDPVLKQLVEQHPSSVRKIPYGVPSHRIENGITVVTLEGHSGVLKVFGEHNLLNLQAAFLACKELGMGPDAFLKGITAFGGAAKRLELLARNERLNIYRDFAHAPSKVKATMEAVKRQFPDRKLIAVLELHTYSSLNEQFLSEYHGALDLADKAVVFYSRHALELKRLPPLSPEKVATGFGRNVRKTGSPGKITRFPESSNVCPSDNEPPARSDLLVLNAKEDLLKWLMEQSYENVNLLLMSSGNYDGLDIAAFANQVAQQGL